MPDIVAAEIETYCEANTTSLPPLLEDLLRETEVRFGTRSLMLSGRVEGLLLQTLVFTAGARRVLEVGTFTGFSALMMAAALPADGELITLELSAEHAEFARGYFDRSDYRERIRLVEGPATESMRALDGRFDLVFIDADKPNYINYYEAALPLLAERGLIVVDNVLWSGQVLDPQDDNGRAISAFNDHVSQDERVVHVMLSVRDGVTVIRKR